MTLRVVVIDDQPLARARLKDLLAEIPDVDLVGEAADGFSARELLVDARPDVAFLDIHMPGPSGLEVLREADSPPLVVFTTAYDQHAVAAFELHALDYLLKPFGGERLRVAVDRARVALASGEGSAQLGRAALALATSPPLERVFVRKAGRICPVPLAEIEQLEARGDYVRLCGRTDSSLVRTTLTDLMTRIDTKIFIRIHRSHAINLNFVTEVTAHDGRRLEVMLQSGKRLVASRAGSVELRARLAG